MGGFNHEADTAGYIGTIQQGLSGGIRVLTPDASIEEPCLRQDTGCTPLDMRTLNLQGKGGTAWTKDHRTRKGFSSLLRSESGQRYGRLRN